MRTTLANPLSRINLTNGGSIWGIKAKCPGYDTKIRTTERFVALRKMLSTHTENRLDLANSDQPANGFDQLAGIVAEAVFEDGFHFFYVFNSCGRVAVDHYEVGIPALDLRRRHAAKSTSTGAPPGIENLDLSGWCSRAMCALLQARSYSLWLIACSAILP